MDQNPQILTLPEKQHKAIQEANPESEDDHCPEPQPGEQQQRATANPSAPDRTNQVRDWSFRKTLVLVIALAGLGKAIFFAVTDLPQLLQGHTKMNNQADEVHQSLQKYNSQMEKRGR